MKTFYYIANVRLPTEKAHGVQIVHMCEAFADEGMAVELILPCRKNTIITDIFEYYQISRKFKVTYLSGIDLVAWGKIGAFINVVFFLISTRLYLRNKKADVIYSRDQLVALFFNNIILELHFLPEHIRWIHVLLWRRTRALIVKTSFIQNELTNRGIKSTKIAVHSNGVDLKKFDIQESKKDLRKKLGLPTDKKIALYSGTFFVHTWKGVQIFLESVQYFSGDEVAVLVGGNEKEIREINQNKYVIAIGKQPHDLIPQYLAAADVLVLPNTKGNTVSEYYTSPLKLFEYMASQVPIVASDLPAVREIAGNDSVLFVEPNKPQVLYDGIKKVFLNPELAEQMVKKAYKVAQNNSWQSHAKDILTFIFTLHESNY